MCVRGGDPINKRQKIVQAAFINNEEAVIKRLKQVYNQSLKDIEKKAQALQDDINRLGTLAGLAVDADEKEKLLSMQQSKVYQKQYQDALKKQVSSILDNMQVEEFKTVSEYLQKCYEDGFVGTMFDLQGQGIPLCFPLDQEAMVRAVQLDSKISEGLYSRLGEDVTVLKKKITAQVSRGIATGMAFQQVAKQLADYTNIGFNNAVRIARTEGHRIQCQATMDACFNAKEMGADVVKIWDATLDGKTRESHSQVDGEIKEIEEKFSNGLMFPGDPSGGAAEVVNCRCALLERARWAVGGSFTKMNNFTKRLETFESPEAYEEFKKGFFSNENKKYMNYVQQMEEKYKTKDFAKVLDSMTDQEYKHYSKLLENNPMFNKKATKASKPKFTPAKTIEEAEGYAKQFVVEKTWSKNGDVSFKGLSVESANTINATLTELYATYDMPKLKNIKPMNFRENIWKSSEKAPMAYNSNISGGLFFNPKIVKDKKCIAKYKDDGRKAFDFCAKNIDRLTGSQRTMVETYIKAGRQLVEDDVENAFAAMIQHEMGHHIQNQIMYKDKDAWKIVRDGFEEYGVKISGYATKTQGEYIAESFCAFVNGEADRIDPALKEYFEGLVK